MIGLKFNGTISSLVKPIVWRLWQRWWVFWRMENKVRDFSTWHRVSRFCWFSFTRWAFHYIIGFDFSPNVNGFSIRRTSWIMVLVQRQDKWPRCSATRLRALINPWFHLSSPGAHGRGFGARNPEHWLRASHSAEQSGILEGKDWRKSSLPFCPELDDTFISNIFLKARFVNL